MTARRAAVVALVLLALAGAAATTGCGAACSASADDEAQVVLLDRSPSDAANLPVYRRLAYAVTRRVAPQGAHVLVSTVGALGDADWEVDRRLAVSARTAFGCRRLQTKAATQVNTAIGALYERPLPSRSSDLIASFIAAGRTLAQEPKPADVWAISDTHQVGSGVDLYHVPLGPGVPDMLVERLREQDLLADLHGARVHFLGAGLARQPLTSRRQRLVESFWRAWVRASHGTVVSYDTRLASLDAPA